MALTGQLSTACWIFSSLSPWGLAALALPSSIISKTFGQICVQSVHPIQIFWSTVTFLFIKKINFESFFCITKNHQLVYMILFKKETRIRCGRWRWRNTLHVLHRTKVEDGLPPLGIFWRNGGKPRSDRPEEGWSRLMSVELHQEEKRNHPLSGLCEGRRC
jgi:hypothetical protein